MVNVTDNDFDLGGNSEKVEPYATDFNGIFYILDLALKKHGFDCCLIKYSQIMVRIKQIVYL